MSKDSDQTSDPKEERARIGTPAGEEPRAGRDRHGTECLTDVCPEHAAPEARRVPDIESLEEEDLFADEVSTSGGLTGTHAKGGMSRGGTQSGGTPPERSDRAKGQPTESND